MNDNSASDEMRHVTIRLAGPNAVGGSEAHLKLITRWSDPQRSCNIETTIGGKAYQAREFDFFEALRTLRRLLIADGYDLFCYGSCINVWATGMARNMGDGSLAYLLLPQEPNTKQPLVEIFGEPPAGTQLGTPDEQEQFWRQCMSRENTGEECSRPKS